MLGPVVLAQEHPGVAGLQAGRVELTGAEVVVLVEVDGQEVDGEKSKREGDRADGGNAQDGDEGTGDGNPA